MGHVMRTQVCNHLNAIQNQEVTQHETHVVASFLYENTTLIKHCVQAV